MNFILDSSLTMAFVLADEATSETDKILDSLGQGGKAFAPALWRWEVGNVILMADPNSDELSCVRSPMLALLVDETEEL